MKRKAAEIVIAALIGLLVSQRPTTEEPVMETEREFIELPWDFGTVEEEPELTQYNIELLARVCMSEAGNEPFLGKVAVVATVLNRCDNWGLTTEAVVYAPNQYWLGYNGAPSEECFQAVAFAIENREIFPADMMYFRNKHYHTFGKPYTQIGAHYFSTQGGN